MAPLPSRQVLESMKRVDLQRLCKDYGVRANLKSEALIDLLLETQSVRPPPSPQPVPRRSVSTRQSSRAGPSRTSSLIIHDLDGDQSDGDNTQTIQQPSPAFEEPEPTPPPATLRTRKAKDLQTSLGVGRPTAVGGAGARAVTRPSSSHRSRKGKSSRMLSRVEPTIEEEPEPIVVEGESSHHGATAVSSNVPASPFDPPTPAPAGSSVAIPTTDLSTQISDAVEPLRVQLDKMQLELRSLDQRNAEIVELKKQVSQLGDLQKRYTLLEAEVRQLRSQSGALTALQDDVKQLKESLSERVYTPPMPSTPKGRSPQLQHVKGVLPSAFKTSTYPPIGDDTSPLNSPQRGESLVHNLLPHPGFTANTLGKRPRDSVASDMTGILEDGQQEGLSEEELAKKVFRPKQKRPRLNSTEPGHAGPSSHDVAAQLSAPRISSFTIYNDATDDFNENYLDAPPPTNGLPDFFAPSSPTDSPTRDDIGSLHHEENHQPFNFSFVPISSTPNPTGPNSFVAPFPFPDPPHSPSPPSNTLGYIGRTDHRTDIFKSFGFPSPRRPRFPEAQSDDTVNPASIAGPSSSSGKQQAISSNDVAVGLRLTRVQTSSSTDPTNAPEPPPAKKTMYGTELEGETRFGDFGVEGVASGFWSGR